MSFFQKIGNAVARFMYGRNGGDQLGIATMWTAVILNLIAGFVGNDILYGVMNLLTTAMMLWSIFRIFSRNLPVRRAENAWFLQKIWWPIKGKFSRSRDKDHKYFTCPNCRTVCRVPRGKGKIVITCPKCRGQIHGKS